MYPITSSIDIAATISDSCMPVAAAVAPAADTTEEVGASIPLLVIGVEALALPVHTKVAVDRRMKDSVGEHHHQQTEEHCSTFLFRTSMDVEAELQLRYHYLNVVSLAEEMPLPVHTCSGCRGCH